MRTSRSVNGVTGYGLDLEKTGCGVECVCMNVCLEVGHSSFVGDCSDPGESPGRPEPGQRRSG